MSYSGLTKAVLWAWNHILLVCQLRKCSFYLQKASLSNSFSMYTIICACGIRKSATSICLLAALLTFYWRPFHCVCSKTIARIVFVVKKAWIWWLKITYLWYDILNLKRLLSAIMVFRWMKQDILFSTDFLTRYTLLAVFSYTKWKRPLVNLSMCWNSLKATLRYWKSIGKVLEYRIMM